MNSYQLLSIICLGLLFQCKPVANGQTCAGESIIPDTTSQMLLEKLHSATSESNAYAALLEIRKITGGDIPSFIPQVICYRAEIARKRSANLISSQEAEKQLAGTYVLFREIASAPDMEQAQSWKIRILKAVSPYMGTTNIWQQDQARWILEKLDYMGAHGRDFSIYSIFLNQQKDAANQGLIEYMYDQDARAAVLALASVYADSSAKSSLDDKLKGDGVGDLFYFVSRPEWWMHLYAATILEKEPYLQTPELLGELEKDNNPMVQKKVSKLKEKMAPELGALPVME